MAGSGRRGGTVRIGIIGLGIGRYHTLHLASRSDVAIVGICEPIQERIDEVSRAVRERGGDLSGCRMFSNYRRMLRDVRPDAVVIAIPNFLHAAATIDALQAGCHVLCEKPMAMDLTEARRMVAVAHKRRRRLMINLSFRFSPESHAIRQIVAAGELGEVYFARTGWMRQAGIPRGTGWFYRKERAGGGPLIDLGVHRIDLAWHLMGEPKVRSVTGQAFRKFGNKLVKGYSVEDLAAGFVRFEDGRCLEVAVSWHSFCEQPELMWTELYGTKGGAVQRNVEGTYKFELHLFKEIAGHRIAAGPIRAPASVPNSLDHFVECLRTNREPGPSGEKVLEIQKILNGLYESARTGREVVFRK